MSKRREQTKSKRKRRPARASGGGRPVELRTQAVAAQAAGQLVQARELFAELLRHEPNDHRALFAFGQVTAQMGDVERAIDSVERAIGVAAPQIPMMYRVALADMLLENRQGERALEVAEEAVGLVEAESQAGRASAFAHSILAACLERFHRIDEALEVCARAEVILPGDARIGVIHGRLLRRAARPAEAVELLRGLTAREPAARVTHTAALHELAMALDKVGDYDEAYATFRRFGSAVAEGPRARRIDRRVALDGLAKLKRAAQRWVEPCWGAEDFLEEVRRAPVFLVGFPRSGTTMTEQILAAHPGITTVDEVPAIAAMGEEAGRRLGAHPHEHFDKLDVAMIRELREFYWERIGEKVEVAAEQVLVDKLPLNILNLALIAQVFPEARIIVALRDPRDACLSCFMQSFGLNESMIQFLSLHGAVRYYDLVMDYYLMLREALKLNVLEVRYEDTVSDLEGQARKMLEHVGVDWDGVVLRFYEAARERFISTPSFEAVTQPVHGGAIGRWRNYEAAFEAELPQLERYLEAFGYDS